MYKMLIAILFTTTAYGQSLGYSDADDAGEALGMMKSTIIAADTMEGECTHRYPDLATDFVEEHNKWKADEKTTIAKTEFYWQKLVKEHPEKAGDADKVPDTVKILFINLEAAYPGQSAQLLNAYCRKYFSELASGIWRIRTPNAYKYLDQSSGK